MNLLDTILNKLKSVNNTVTDITQYPDELLSAYLMKYAWENHGMNTGDTDIPNFRFKNATNGESNGSIQQRTYLLPKKERQRVFERNGWIKEDKTDNNYGLVKRAGKYYNAEIYKKNKDAINRNKLIPIGMSYEYNGPSKTALSHVGMAPVAYYINPETNEFYNQQFDLNNYGNEDNSAGAKYGTKQILANLLDHIGNPVVVKSGIQPVVQSPSYSNYGKIQTLDNNFHLYETDSGKIEYNLDAANNILKDYLNKQGLTIYRINGKPTISIPEVNIYGKNKSKNKKQLHLEEL